MLPDRPPTWGIEAAAVDPRFKRFWRDPAFALSPWNWDRAHDLVNKADAAQSPTSSVGALGRGWDCLNVNDDTYILSWPTSSPNTHLAGPLEWTIFLAYEFDAIMGFGVRAALLRNSEFGNGGYSVRIYDNDIEMHFHSPTDGQAFNQWLNSYPRQTGYHSFILTRRADGRVRAFVNGVDLGDPTGEDIQPDEIVEPYSGTGNFRLNDRTEVNGRMLSAWVSRGVSVNARAAALLHNDPWAVFRPAPLAPAIFGGMDSSAGSSVSGTAAAGSGPTSASASAVHGVAGSATAQSGAASATASGSAGTAPTDVSGDAAAMSGPATASASGVHGVAGAIDAASGAAFGTSSGAVLVHGPVLAAGAAARVDASGSHTPPAGVTIGTAQLHAATLSAQGWGLAVAPPDYSGIGDAFILEVGVPYSVNSIINGALDLIASNGIASLSDSSSHVGNAIKRNFDVERDSLLREYPWNFAMRRTKLAASSKAPAFRFAHAYELPTGPDPEFCLRVWAVGDEESRQDSDVWEISGRRLLTDLEAPLPVRYIGRIVNPALWDPLTVKALEARLAWQAAYLASGSAALAEQMARIYQERLDAAKAIDAQEGTPEPFEDGTTWVDARLTGVTW